MTYDGSAIRGPNLVLRLIQPDDAAYVHSLRTDPAYNRHLTPVQGTVDEQRHWIDAYKAREASGCELYFVIERNDGLRCGLVRLYDIVGPDHFTWGSWILDHNKPRKAALESALLSFGVGFEQLGCARALLDVHVENAHATAFYRRLGMTETHRTAEQLFFVYPRVRYDADRTQLLSLLQPRVTA